MLCFIDFDGKGVLKWDMFADGIILEDGRIIPCGHHEERVFAVHPDDNENIERVGGIYFYKGETLLDQDRLNTTWETVKARCGHSACSQNYIDTGELGCVL